MGLKISEKVRMTATDVYKLRADYNKLVGMFNAMEAWQGKVRMLCLSIGSILFFGGIAFNGIAGSLQGIPGISLNYSPGFGYMQIGAIVSGVILLLVCKD